jgi:hypothetical protein
MADNPVNPVCLHVADPSGHWIPATADATGAIGGGSSGVSGYPRVRSCLVSSGTLPVQATSGWVTFDSPGVIAAAITGIVLATAPVAGANTLLRWAIDPSGDAEAAVLLPIAGMPLSPNADLGNIDAGNLDLVFGGATPITGTVISVYIPIEFVAPTSGDALRAIAFAHNLGVTIDRLIVTGWEKV